ncbi:hypothetical protein [Bilophila sp.]|uniref:hypothetical protein n=1 Tax=Bilophila sp. TaxID=1929485 RepID=UPI003076EE27
MRKILFTLAACLLLATAAQAETLTIGDENIAYNVPGGYMAGNEEPYISVRSFLTEVSPKNVQILALYVNKESHKKFLDPVNQRLEDYFLLSTLRPLVDKELSVKDFAELKKGFIKAQEQLKTALRQKANDMLNNASDGTLGIGAVDSLGVFDASDTSFSFMAVVDQVSDADGQRTVDKQSAVSSFLLAQGKVIIINQYQILDPSKDMAQQLDAAKTQAQKILKELGIKQGVPWASYLGSFPTNILLFAVIGGLVGGLIRRTVKNRKNTTA